MLLLQGSHHHHHHHHHHHWPDCCLLLQAVDSLSILLQSSLFPQCQGVPHSEEPRSWGNGAGIPNGGLSTVGSARWGAGKELVTTHRPKAGRKMWLGGSSPTSRNWIVSRRLLDSDYMLTDPVRFVLRMFFFFFFKLIGSVTTQRFQVNRLYSSKWNDPLKL